MPMKVKIIGKDDIEGLNYLAEEILMQLRFEGYRFDNEGNDRCEEGRIDGGYS